MAPAHSPELAFLSWGWECQEQQANVDQDLVGFWADLGDEGWMVTAIEDDHQSREVQSPLCPTPGPTSRMTMS